MRLCAVSVRPARGSKHSARSARRRRGYSPRFPATVKPSRSFGFRSRRTGSGPAGRLAPTHSRQCPGQASSPISSPVSATAWSTAIPPATNCLNAEAFPAKSCAHRARKSKRIRPACRQGTQCNGRTPSGPADSSPRRSKPRPAGRPAARHRAHRRSRPVAPSCRCRARQRAPQTGCRPRERAPDKAALPQQDGQALAGPPPLRDGQPGKVGFKRVHQSRRRASTGRPAAPVRFPWSVPRRRSPAP